MKWFKFTVAVLVAAVLTSSCSTSKAVDELLVREAELQKGIETEAENCELVWLLETYASWAQIGLYSLQPSEAKNIASKLKSYTLDVFNLSKLDPYLAPEYLNDLTFIIEKINSEDLASRFYTQLGRTYFPDCGYFSIDSDSTGTQNQVPQLEKTKQKDISFSGLGATSGTEKMFFKGSYKVNWRTEGTCYYSGDLKGGNLASFDYINAFNVQDLAEGTTNIYDLAAGEYFLKVITGPTPNCPWGVTFVPMD